MGTIVMEWEQIWATPETLTWHGISECGESHVGLTGRPRAGVRRAVFLPRRCC